MSVTTAFRHPKAFPFCVPTLDVGFSDVEYYVYPIKDLTLADAMNLYWNTESIHMVFQYTAAISAPTNSASVGISWTTNASVSAPRSRVCADGGTWFVDDESVFPNAEVYGSGSPEDVGAGVQFPGASDLADTLSVVRQTNGLYTMFLSALDTGGVVAGRATLLGCGPFPTPDFAYTGVVYTIPILSGHTRVEIAVAADQGTPGTASFTTAVISPNFYSYP